MGIEAQQVRLRLTRDKSVLKWGNKRKAIKTDAKGDKLVLQFDAQPFEFRPGIAVVVGASIAKELIRRSNVIVGDDLTGDLAPLLEVVGKFELGQESAEDVASMTMCPVCHKQMGSLARLASHLQGPAHRKERADLYEDKKVEGQKIDYDTPLEEQEPNATSEPMNLIDISEDESLDQYDTNDEDMTDESGDVR